VGGGLLADKIGGKKVLGFGVVWWSIATVFTPIAASMGMPMLLFSRAMMGVGEGVKVGVGSIFDRAFVRAAAALGADEMGERGEFHTHVTFK
jgi:MFS family permease